MDVFVYVGREEEIAPASLADDVVEARLVNGKGKVRAVPGVDALLVEIDDGDLDVGALERDDGARWPAWVRRDASVSYRARLLRSRRRGCSPT